MKFESPASDILNLLTIIYLMTYFKIFVLLRFDEFSNLKNLGYSCYFFYFAKISDPRHVRVHKQQARCLNANYEKYSEKN